MISAAIPANSGDMSVIVDGRSGRSVVTWERRNGDRRTFYRSVIQIALSVRVRHDQSGIVDIICETVVPAIDIAKIVAVTPIIVKGQALYVRALLGEKGAKLETGVFPGGVVA